MLAAGRPLWGALALNRERAHRFVGTDAARLRFRCWSVLRSKIMGHQQLFALIRKSCHDLISCPGKTTIWLRTVANRSNAILFK